MLRLLARLAVFAALAAALLEVFFRTALPASESPIPWQEPTLGLLLYDPATPTGVFTSGRLAEQRATWHINAQGWNAGLDYPPVAPGDAPLIAVLGDSQIEGLYVDWPDNIAARLTALSGGRVQGRAYGGSGYPLASFALVGRYLAQTGQTPAVIAVTINRGDFYYSIRGYGRPRPTMPTWSYDAATGAFTHHAPGPYRVRTVRRLLRASALVRYLFFNAGINPLAGDTVELGMVQRDRWPEAEPAFQPVMAAAAGHLLDELRAALPAARVVFVVEADRRAIHEDHAPAPLEAVPVLRQVCQARGCGVLDLTPAMQAAFRADGQPLNFPHNAHWNAHGHDVAARALYQWLVAEGLAPPT